MSTSTLTKLMMASATIATLVSNANATDVSVAAAPVVEEGASASASKSDKAIDTTASGDSHPPKNGLEFCMFGMEPKPVAPKEEHVAEPFKAEIDAVKSAKTPEELAEAMKKAHVAIAAEEAAARAETGDAFKSAKDPAALAAEDAHVADDAAAFAAAEPKKSENTLAKERAALAKDPTKLAALAAFAKNLGNFAVFSKRRRALLSETPEEAAAAVESEALVEELAAAYAAAYAAAHPTDAEAEAMTMLPEPHAIDQCMPNTDTGRVGAFMKAQCTADDEVTISYYANDNCDEKKPVGDTKVMQNAEDMTMMKNHILSNFVFRVNCKPQCKAKPTPTKEHSGSNAKSANAMGVLFAGVLVFLGMH